MVYNRGYDCYIDINIKGGIDVIYKGEVLTQYIGSKGKFKHPYPLVFVPEHGEACVHRLVAYSYGVLKKTGEHIDHIDNNPYNSLPWNLRVANNHDNAEYRKYQEPRSEENMRLWKEHWIYTTKTNEKDLV